LNKENAKLEKERGGSSTSSDEVGKLTIEITQLKRKLEELQEESKENTKRAEETIRKEKEEKQLNNKVKKNIEILRAEKERLMRTIEEQEMYYKETIEEYREKHNTKHYEVNHINIDKELTLIDHPLEEKVENYTEQIANQDVSKEEQNKQMPIEATDEIDWEEKEVDPVIQNKVIDSNDDINWRTDKFIIDEKQHIERPVKQQKLIEERQEQEYNEDVINQKSKSALESKSATEEQSIAKSQRLEDLNWGDDDLDITEEINNEQLKQAIVEDKLEKAKEVNKDELKEATRPPVPQNIENVKEEKKEVVTLGEDIVWGTDDLKLDEETNIIQKKTEVAVKGQIKSVMDIDWGTEEFPLDNNKAEHNPIAPSTISKEYNNPDKNKDKTNIEWNEDPFSSGKEYTTKTKTEQIKKAVIQTTISNDIDWGTDDLNLENTPADNWGSTTKPPINRSEAKLPIKVESKPKGGLNSINWDEDDVVATKPKEQSKIVVKQVPKIATHDGVNKGGDIDWGAEDLFLDEPVKNEKVKDVNKSTAIESIGTKKEVLTKEPAAKHEPLNKKSKTFTKNPFAKKEEKQKQMPSFKVATDDLF